MAYVDTSAALAIAFGENYWELTARKLAEFQLLVSSNLLEAELRAAYARYGQAYDGSAISSIGWVHPHRPLGPEMATALAAGGYLKGADLWHIAAALYVDASIIGKLAFITLDKCQRAAADRLGFETDAETWEFPPPPPLSAATRKRWAELRARGIITGGNPEGAPRSFQPIAHVPGALARFLAERG